ncbi:MAG: TolC family protein [Opitutae bacterium]|nr:TolC family protein [Opitutae bacterium]
MYHFLKLGRVAAFALIVQSTLSTLTAAPLTLTKEQAVVRALQQNPALNAARTTIDRAQGNRLQAGRWANPELSIDYATDETFNDEGEYAYSVGFEQRFPVTNRLRLQKEIAQDEIEIAQAEVANQVRVLTRAVEASLVSVTAIEAQIKLRDERLELNRSFVEFMESRFETGEVSSVAANQVQIELYAVEQEKQALANELLLQRATLKQLIGADVDTALRLVHSFELPAVQPELASLTHASLMQHPEYRMKALLYRISDKRISVTKAERWADIAVRVFFEEERGVDDPGGLGTDRFFGVGVSIPLPLLDRKEGALQASRAEQRQIKYELDRVGLEVRSEAHTQAARATSLYQQALSYDQNLTQLVEKNLTEMNAAYAAGQINLAELFRSQEQSLSMQSAQLTKLHDFEQAMIRWKAATARYSEE